VPSQSDGSDAMPSLAHTALGTSCAVVLVAWLAEHILVFRPADERRFKAEFVYDNRKGVGPCDRGLSGLGTRGRTLRRKTPGRCPSSPVSIPGRSVTQARHLYVSRLANSVIPQRQDGAHEMRESRDTSLAMRSPCQTRPLIPDVSTQGSRPKRHPCRMAGGKRPVSRPAEERGLKPSLATTTAKASERVIADPSGLGQNDDKLCESDPKGKTVHMKCAVSLKRSRVSYPVPSPGRSVTRARRLYVSRLANSV